MPDIPDVFSDLSPGSMLSSALHGTAPHHAVSELVAGLQPAAASGSSAGSPSTSRPWVLGQVMVSGYMGRGQYLV